MKILQGKSFFVCDVDGTILDRMPFYTSMFVEIAGRHGIHPDRARDHYLKSAGDTLQKQFEDLFRAERVLYTLELIEEYMSEFFARAENAPTILFPDARETLNALSKQGLLLFATSGARTNHLEILFAHHSLPQFALILGSDRLPKGTEHIREFAHHAGLSIEDFANFAILVGDGPTDMRIAKEHNIIGVGVTTTTTAKILLNAGATVTIPSLSSIFTV